MSRIEKQSPEHKALHVSDPFLCWKMCEFLLDIKCSRTRACYVGETNRHLATSVREHLASEIKEFANNKEGQTIKKLRLVTGLKRK